MRSGLFGGLLPVLLLLSPALLALKIPGQGEPGVEPAESLQPRKAEPETAPGPEDTTKESAPPPVNGGFVPSERIKADSAVSFPVDI